MKKHFVVFLSPGTFVSETTTREVDSWDVKQATEMAKEVKERHGATPYGFQFITRERGDSELDSKVTKRSGTYYLGGIILTLEDVVSRNNPKDSILISNMRGNGYKRIIENRNSYLVTMPFNDDDTLLEFKAA